MNSIIHVACPRCHKQLKAPQSSAGKRVQCPRTGCGCVFVVPRPRQTVSALDVPSSQPPCRKAVPQAKPARRIPWDVIWVAAAFLFVALFLGSGYWWMGQPSSSLVAAYEDYIRTGNELVDLHEGVTDQPSAKRLEAQLKAKAQEHLECRKRKDELDRATSKRIRANAEERFGQQIDKLQVRIAQLMISNRPLILLPAVSDNNEYVVLELGSLHSQAGGPPKSDDPKPSPTWKLEAFAGHWVAKDISFDIEPDGRGRAEFDHFSQGSGSFTFSRGDKPVKLSANFRIEARNSKPVFSFELSPEPGLVSQYEFEILLDSGADELKVKELRGGRINPNPTVMRRKVKSSEPEDVARLDDLVGDWETPALSLKIERGGKGKYVWLFSSGNSFAETVGDLTVQEKDGKILLSMSPTVFGEKLNYQFIARLNGDKTILELKEAENRIKPKTLKKKAAVTKRTDPPTPPPSPKPAATAIQLSDLKVTKTTFTPPSVAFTIRLDLAGGELLEAWASVGVKDAGKTLEVFAGALHDGLLSVNGIDFANPDPSLKAQRVSMTRSASDKRLYECAVRYPKVALDKPETEFTIVAAVRKDKKIVKTNAATVRLNLKTGEVLSAQK